MNDVNILGNSMINTYSDHKSNIYVSNSKNRLVRKVNIQALVQEYITNINSTYTD